jgi:hypothetical protein
MRKLLIINLASAFSLIFILLTTTPKSLPSAFLLIPFLLMFIFMFTFWVGLLRLYKQGRSRAIRLALLFSVLPTLMMVLQSIDQLTVRDIVGIGVLMIVAQFYMSRFFVIEGAR